MNKEKMKFLWVDDHSREKNDDGSWRYLNHFVKDFESVFPEADIITSLSEDETRRLLSFPCDRIKEMPDDLLIKTIHAWPIGVILDLNLAGTHREDLLAFLKKLRRDHALITSETFKGKFEDVLRETKPGIAEDVLSMQNYGTDIPIIALTNMTFQDILKDALSLGANAIFDRSRSEVDEATGDIISAYMLSAREMKRHLC